MLEAASRSFAVTPAPGTPAGGCTGARVETVCGPLKTTVTLLRDGKIQLCLVFSDLPMTSVDLSRLVRRRVAGILGLPTSHVLTLSSHSHSTAVPSRHSVARSRPDTTAKPPERDEPDLLPVGRTLLKGICGAARALPDRLEPVSVWRALGHEKRISYNRKGRRADGSTFFMREEDRILYGRDFRGDIDTEAPVVCLKSSDGRPLTFITQFTAHPVTSYHPEHPVIHGDYPAVAGDVLAGHFKDAAPTVGFLQGCAGDVNSKHMFAGDVGRARQYGRWLGQTHVRATKDLRPSRCGGMDYAIDVARVPFAPLPGARLLEREIAEIEDFIARVNAGDEDALFCVGLNFPRALTPAYRAKLAEDILPWSQWALDRRRRGLADQVPRHLEVEVHTIRLGDVGIVALPCEPFQGIGRQIRKGSPLPLTIPCGYTNAGCGYITDGPNTGDREFMSAMYRYTRYWPPFKKPAGDVLARTAVRRLTRMALE